MTMENITKLRRFRRLAFITVLLTIFLIWVGGWVRSTGSGMGCPDWPKCFDMWVPPTDSTNLPSNYLEHYVELRQKKNTRVGKLLTKMGFAELAHKIENDPSVFEHEPFNAYKTWTEYINRLLGVLVGFAILATFIASIRLRSYDKRLFWLSLAAFLGVVFEGWLGSIVVSTNLMPGFITVHMFVAMLIVMFLIMAVLHTEKHIKGVETVLNPQKLSFLIGVGVAICVFILIQIVIGTQVREGVDIVSRKLGEANRAEWLDYLGTAYDIHRLFYYFLAAVVLYWAWQIHHNFTQQGIKRLNFLTVFSLLGVIALGIVMHRFGIPPIAQPLHLLVASVLFSSAFSVTYKMYLR